MKYIAPALWILVFQLIGIGIGVITSSNMDWYDGLEKSPLNPPDFVFPVVWSLLYVMLALAGWLAWSNRKTTDGAQAHNLFWMQMFLNWGWSFVFFELQLVFVGFLWIMGLLLAMLAFIVSAWRVDRRASMLVIPTVIWGSFAACLNVAIWILN